MKLRDGDSSFQTTESISGPKCVMSFRNGTIRNKTPNCNCTEVLFQTKIG